MLDPKMYWEKAIDLFLSISYFSMCDQRTPITFLETMVFVELLPATNSVEPQFAKANQKGEKVRSEYSSQSYFARISTESEVRTIRS